MALRIDNAPDSLTVWLSGELDHHSARRMREEIDAAVERTKPARLRLDFGGVAFMDSSGIGLIMGRFRLMQLYGGTLEVTGASERIRKVIRLAGLDRLNVLKDGDEAGPALPEDAPPGKILP